MRVLGKCCFFLALLLSQGSISVAGGSNLSGGKLAEKGSALFLQYCAHCHGLKGGGDGYNSKFLEKEPANLSDPEFMTKKKDSQIFRVIQKGGVGVNKSHLMPVFGYTLSEEEIWSLVAYVRTLSGGSIKPSSIPESFAEDKPNEFELNHSDIEKFSLWFFKGPDPGLIDAGKKIFKKKKSCLACHRIKKEFDEDEDEKNETKRYEGGHVGPNLSQAGFVFAPEWLYV